MLQIGEGGELALPGPFKAVYRSFDEILEGFLYLGESLIGDLPRVLCLL
jgi:hypothetical protein